MTLSIITINYNNLDGLKRTIDSILIQTWRDFEWLLIDGGSTDGSKELIAETAKSCPNISFWCSEPDKGVYNAMNKGVSHARGEYMNFMNSGDTFYDEKVLEKVFKEKHKADVLYGDWIRVFKDHKEKVLAPKEMFQFMVFFTNVCHQAMFIKGDLQKQNPYDESYKALADWLLWRAFAIKGLKFEYVPFTICCYEAEDGISSSNATLYFSEKDRLCTDDCIPQVLQLWLKNYNQDKDDLFRFRRFPMVWQMVELCEERSIYKNMFFISVGIIKGVRYLVEILAIPIRLYRNIKNKVNRE